VINDAPPTRSIVFGQTQIPFTLHRSGRRDVAITVNADASVAVIAPPGTALSMVEAAVRRRAAWIIRQRDWLQRHWPRRPRQFVSGESCLYLGRQYQLQISPNSPGQANVRLEGGKFKVDLPNSAATSDLGQLVRPLLVRWYRRHALPYLAELAENQAKKLGVDYAEIRLLEMPTRWGSGGKNGKLRFNWRLMLAPRRLVEYVVAHELVHLRHPHHSANFWRTLGTIVPDWQQRRDELDLRGPSFDL